MLPNLCIRVCLCPVSMSVLPRLEAARAPVSRVRASCLYGFLSNGAEPALGSAYDGSERGRVVYVWCVCEYPICGFGLVKRADERLGRRQPLACHHRPILVYSLIADSSRPWTIPLSH